MFEFLKILHIVGFTSWMAGLFYLPRLFVYHCGTHFGSETDKTFQIMEYKLYFYIMQPAMIITILSGIVMLVLKYVNKDLPEFQLWGLVKMVSVLLLVVYHYRLNIYRKKFIGNTNTKSHRFFRVLNEVPTLIFIILISAVVIKFAW